MRLRLGFALLGLVLAGCGGGDSERAAPPLTELAGVESLAGHFADAAGKPRLVVVFSPT